MTLADIGKAEMPAAPIIGLSFFLENRFISLAKPTPAAVSKMNAKSPSARMSKVSSCRKASPLICDAIVKPKSSVIRLASMF